MIGAYVVEAATSRGMRVIGLDRTAPRPEIHELLEEFVLADLETDSPIRLPDVSIHGTLHLAGISDLEQATQDPGLAWKVNVDGTAKILRLAEEHGVQRFLLASSLYAGTNAGSEYGFSKLGAEALLRTWGPSLKMSWGIARIGSVYGRHAPDNNTIQRIASAVVTGVPLRLSVSQDAIRSYIHAADLASILVKSVFEKEGEALFVVEGSSGWRIRDVVKLAEELSEKEIQWSAESSRRYKTTPLSVNHPPRTLRPAEYEISLPHGLQDLLESLQLNSMPSDGVAGSKK